MSGFNIAIDGPAGAGKSTAAREIASRLALKYIDTGAMYRALTWKGIIKGIDFHQPQEIESLTLDTKITIEKGPGGSNLLYLDNVDVTAEIRDPAVNRNVSLVAKNPKVRETMVSQQQVIASNGGVVMDGRDIGTNVLPGAEFKFFITASLEERARRRYLELKEHGHDTTLEEVKKDINIRDKIDSERELAPLVAAEDAVLVDTTNLSAEEVVGKMVKHIKEHIQAGSI